MEHLLRDINDPSVSTLANQVKNGKQSHIQGAERDSSYYLCLCDFSVLQP